MSHDGSINIDTSIDSKGFKNGLDGLSSIAGKALSTIGTSILGASAALIAGAVAGVKYNNEMEQYMASFTTMLGNADKATEMVAGLKDFAAKTPFEFTDLASGAKTLMAFGIASDDVTDRLKMLGDVSQGNAETFNSLTLAFGQVSSAGKMSGQDLLKCVA